MKTRIFALESDNNQVLICTEDDDGWLHINKLGNHPDNIFSSKEEIELFLDVKLIELKKKIKD